VLQDLVSDTALFWQQKEVWCPTTFSPPCRWVPAIRIDFSAS